MRINFYDKSWALQEFLCVAISCCIGASMASLTLVIVDHATFFRFVIVLWASDELISVSFSSGFQLLHLYALFGLCFNSKRVHQRWHSSSLSDTILMLLICKFAGNIDIICSKKLLVCNITCSVVTHLQAHPPPLFPSDLCVIFYCHPTW